MEAFNLGVGASVHYWRIPNIKIMAGTALLKKRKVIVRFLENVRKSLIL